MTRYCSCYRGIGFSNRTSVVHDSLMGVDICSHCGGVVPPERPFDYNPYMDFDELEGRNKDHVNPITDYCEKAEACSMRGDHSNAIKFYRKALKLYGPTSNCEMLAPIADEYEAMGDYASAEDCLMRCCEEERHDSYKYIALKGDFLYRRRRYEEAVGAYEEALKIMNGVKDKNVSLEILKCHARATHFIISSYMCLGVNNPEEKYHEELKRVINRYLHSTWVKNDETAAHYIAKKAWEIYEDDQMTDEALILIDRAIELNPTADYYHRKAIFIKRKLELKAIVNRIKPHDLDLIDEALEMLPDDSDNGPYLKTRGEILDQLGDPVNARLHYALAAKNYDIADKVEKQLEELKSGATFINITGIHYYQGFTPFSKGTVVDLVKEPDNPHDRNAIRVEINGETVGYVANSEYTMIKQVKSATDIKDSKSTQAEVRFVLFNEWVIAKLI